MAILIGLVFLVIGNFLGGIWANESWGRYWGWDPKETWTLVSILIYSIIIHLHYIKKLNRNFIFSSLTMIAYSSIIMTYFGVNYYLTGKHSYAAGDAIPIPTFVPIGIIIMILILTTLFNPNSINKIIITITYFFLLSFLSSTFLSYIYIYIYKFT